MTCVTRLQRPLDELVDDQDRLAVEVLRVQQVLPRPVLRVVRAHPLREVVLPPRGEVLLDQVGRRVQQVELLAAQVPLQNLRGRGERDFGGDRRAVRGASERHGAVSARLSRVADSVRGARGGVTLLLPDPK